MIELYEAYSDYNDMMDLTEDLVSSVAQKVLGTMKITYEETEIDLTPPWRRATMAELVKEATGIDFDAITVEEAHEAARENHMKDDFKYDIEHTSKGDVSKCHVREILRRQADSAYLRHRLSGGDLPADKEEERKSGIYRAFRRIHLRKRNL